MVNIKIILKLFQKKFCPIFCYWQFMGVAMHCSNSRLANQKCLQKIWEFSRFFRRVFDSKIWLGIRNFFTHLVLVLVRAPLWCLKFPKTLRSIRNWKKLCQLLFMFQSNRKYSKSLFWKMRFKISLCNLKKEVKHDFMLL